MRYLVLALALAIAPFSVNAQRSVGPLSQPEINQIVGAVLARKEVAMFLHPEVPERLPVKVAIAPPYSGIPVDLVLYGKPVRIVSDSADAVSLQILSSGDSATVNVSYRREGMAGTVKLERTQARWKAVEARIYEH